MKKPQCSEKDFDINSLPQTRRAQFFDILKLNYRTLMVLGLIILSFFLPWLVKNFVIGIFNDSISVSIAEKKISESDGEGARKILMIINYCSDIILFPVALMGLGGPLRVIQRHCYSEGVLLGYELKKGFKENWLRLFILGLILGAVTTVSGLLLIFFPLTFLSIASLIILALVFVPVSLVCAYYSTIYINPLGKSLYHSNFVYLKSNWKTLLFIIALLGPFLALEFSLNLALIRQLIYAALLVFFTPIVILGGYCLYLHEFDESFNIVHCKEQYRRGLYNPDKQEQK